MRAARLPDRRGGAVRPSFRGAEDFKDRPGHFLFSLTLRKEIEGRMGRRGRTGKRGPHGRCGDKFFCGA